MLSLEYLIATYGYWALLAGTFLEGETVLILAGFAAHRGYLQLPWVILIAFMGAFAGDQFYFFLGRWKGQAFLQARPAWQGRVARVNRLIERYHTPIILSCRFLYGLRLAFPFAIGMSRVAALRFVLLNAVSAAVWAVAGALGGYLFGSAMEVILRDLRRYELEVITGLIFAGLLFWGINFYRRKKMEPPPG